MGDQSPPASRRQACCALLRRALWRSKPLDHDTVMETPLNRNFNQFDILMYGIGAMLGNSIYGVIAVVARRFTGPSTFLSFLLAGFAALLNGFCYSELSAHIPRAGSAYAYTYVIAGEFLAFVTGWLMLLEYALSACSAAVTASYNLDILSNGTISRGIIEHVGQLTDSSTGIFNRYPNFLACLICLIAVAVLSSGNLTTTWTNIVLSAITLTIIAIATGYMYSKFDHRYFVKNPHDFFPHGAAGLLSGAGIAFNAFIGFDAISVAGEEVKNPRRAIPIAITSAVAIVVVVCTIHSVAFVGYTPWWKVNAQMGLAFVFYDPPILWLRVIVSIGAVIAALCNVICCVFAIPRIAYSMASDGLIFTWLSWIHPTLKVPLIPLFIFGGFTAVISLFFNYASLVSFLSVGTLISYIFVACDLLILRFMKPELYLVKDPNEVGFLYHQFRFLKFIDSRSRGLVPLCAVVCFIIISAILILFCLETSNFLSRDIWWSVFIVVLLVCIIVICIVIIALHRPYSVSNTDAETFEAPLVPFVPLLSIFIDIALIIKLPVLTWARVGGWLLLGFILYFSYGIFKSKLNNEILPVVEDYSTIPGMNGEEGRRSRRQSIKEGRRQSIKEGRRQSIKEARRQSLLEERRDSLKEAAKAYQEAKRRESIDSGKMSPRDGRVDDERSPIIPKTDDMQK